nr:ribbon-helix-helix domain-containing protein [Mesorhizobium camelthorni]
MVRKRSVSIRGHRTSYSLEQPFFDELVAIAAERQISFAALIAEIDASRPRDANLSSALRLFVLEETKRKSAAASKSEK